MTETVIRELASSIAREQFLLQWPFYLLLLAITLAAGFGSAYVGAYARRRGEALATRADFEALLSQLKATTAVAEEVKVRVSHADWISRESRTVRRIKLEELMTAVHDLQEWQSAQLHNQLFNGAPAVGPAPAAKLERLASLYFPELRLAVLKVTQAHGRMMVGLWDGMENVLKATGNPEAEKAARAQVSAAWHEGHRDWLQITGNLEEEARVVMEKLLADKS